MKGMTCMDSVEFESDDGISLEVLFGNVLGEVYHYLFEFNNRQELVSSLDVEDRNRDPIVIKKSAGILNLTDIKIVQQKHQRQSIIVFITT